MAGWAGMLWPSQPSDSHDSVPDHRSHRLSASVLFGRGRTLGWSVSESGRSESGVTGRERYIRADTLANESAVADPLLLDPLLLER